MAVNKRLLQGATAAGGLTPSEHFGVVLYEGDGASSHSINGGKFGAGGYFTDSNSSYISRDSGFLPMGNAARTFSFWVMVNTHSTDQYFLSYGDGANGQFFSPRIRPTNQGGYIGFMGYAADLDSNVVMTTGEWMHLCYTYDGTTLKIYKNATEIASGSLSLNTSTARDFTIGARDLDGTRSKHMNGKLDQLRIFTKALSSSEVSTLYAETDPTSLDPLSEDTTDTLQVLGDSSCIAAYRFENNEDDLSGNYDGTGTAIQYAAGRYGQAASYDGSNSKVSISALGFLTGDVDFSVSMWVKFENVSGDKCLFSQGANAGTYQASGYIVRGNNQVYHNNYGSADFFSGSFTFSADVWTHIAFSYNSTSNVHTMYINGSSAGTVTKEIALQSNNTGGCIGADQLGGSKFKGEIDQVRVFNKTISASEVTTLYNENSLVASYRFEGNANDDTRNYDGTASNVTYEYGLGFQPDLIWAKARDRAGEWHMLSDSTRGTNSQLFSNATNAQDTKSTVIQSFDTGGFTVGSDALVNFNGSDYVAWCWKANGGTTSSNTDGSVTSTVQANTDAGFSIVQYTGSGVAGDTIGHGLSAAPELIIVKNRSINRDWSVVGSAIVSGGSGNDGTRRLVLNDTVVSYNDGFGLQSATDTTFAFEHNNSIANNTDNFIAYAFHSVENFSSFGSYTGNGSANGPIVETGFEPAFVIIKKTSGISDWHMYDNKRQLVNPRTIKLNANGSDAEYSFGKVDFLSNGFQILNSDTAINQSGGTYLYMAFAADPDTEAPTVAKSFSAVTYTGTGADQSITGLGFKPSLLWLKNRDTVENHFLVDSVRGASELLFPNKTLVETTATGGGVASFDSDGFSLQAPPPNYGINLSNLKLVAWAWKADDNEPTINTEGSIDSVVSVNANAGFSIVKYTGTFAAATVGHGLSSAPEMVIVKNLDSTTNWWVWHTDLGGGTKYLKLNGTDAVGTVSSIWNSTVPTSTVFSVANDGGSNGSGNEIIAYCFHSVSGFSKISSYVGNGGSNSITGLGFQPDFVMIKSTGSGSWFLYDSVRSVSVGDNAGTANARPYILANSDGKENGTTSYNVDLDSNGFSINTSAGDLNTNGTTYIYMAFKIN